MPSFEFASSGRSSSTRDNAEDAIGWLRQQNQSTNNWFLWLAFNASHTPYHKPPAAMCPHYTALGAVQGDDDRTSRPHYEAITEAMDTAIGWVMTNINLEATTVIFLGDNGTLGTVIQPPYSTNHAKGTLYEGGIRVPLIIAGAGVAHPHRETTHLVHTVDLFATILEMAGVNLSQALPANYPCDSVSLLPILQDPAARAARDWVLSENFSPTLETNLAGRCLRNQQFKLIEFKDGRRELYDLWSDPFETNNLYGMALTTTQTNNYVWLHEKLASLQNAPRIACQSAFLGRRRVAADYLNGAEFTLWSAADLAGNWARVEDALVTLTTNLVRLTDPDTNGAARFYRVSVPTR